MLNDRERETLREVQRQIVSEDPDFARSFDAIAQQDSHGSVPWAHRMPRWVYTAATVTAMAFGVLMLTARAPGTALVFAALATVTLVARCRHNDVRAQHR